MKVLILRPFLIIWFSIISYSSFSQKIPVLALDDAYKRQESITTNEFIDSFTYIPLETAPQCLVGANPKIYLTDKYLIITDQQNNCFLFDKITGKFIRTIGHYGRDPGGYRNARGFFNESTSTIYFSGWKNDLIKYSMEGESLGSVPIPRYNDSFTDAFIPDKYDYLDNNLIACNIINTNGIQKILIMIFDEKGNEVKTVPNRNLTKEHKFSLSIGNMKFFHFDGNLRYFEIFNDTIFNLQLDKVVPYMILQRGRYRYTRENRRSDADKILPRTFSESEKFIIFDFWGDKNKTFFTLYNKTTSKLKVCEFTFGIINDTDGFIPFLPKTIFKEDVAGLVQAADMISWFENNKGLTLKLPPDLKEFSSLELTDNPVLVIAKLKE